MFKVNDNYLKLPGSYLFSTIAKKVNAFTAANPQACVVVIQNSCPNNLYLNNPWIIKSTSPLAASKKPALKNKSQDIAKLQKFIQKTLYKCFCAIFIHVAVCKTNQLKYN